MDTAATDLPPALVLCHAYKLGLIGRKRPRCKETAAKTGSVDPLSRCDAADGAFAANPAGGGRAAVSFGARRQCMFPYTFLLASRPQPPGPPSILICRLDRAPAQYQFNDINPANTPVYWVGLAISYSETVTITLNGSTLTGPLGSAPWNDGLFQELNQAITGKLDSGDSYVPGS